MTLDDAWKEAEAALPEGIRIDSFSQKEDGSEWGVWAHGEWQRAPDPADSRYRKVAWATGPTPADALHALAQKLRAGQPETEG